MTSFWFLFLVFFGLHLLCLVDICSGSIVQINDTTTLLLATTEKRVTYNDDSLHRLDEQEGKNLNSAAQKKSTVVSISKEKQERRKLDACPTLILGEAFVEINVERCSMSAQVDVGNGQHLRVRGVDSLVHPVLDRGGVPKASVFSRHFVLTGSAEMTLENLELTGAWVGRDGGHCDYCLWVRLCLFLFHLFFYFFLFFCVLILNTCACFIVVVIFK